MTETPNTPKQPRNPPPTRTLPTRITLVLDKLPLGVIQAHLELSYATPLHLH